MDIHISDFAKNINFPLTHFMDEFRHWPHNEEKEEVSFMSGDPTIYGQKQFQMPQRGYEIIKECARNENNHGYIGSTGTAAFRQAVMKLYNTKVPLKVSDVQINHGVNMGLLAVFMALTNEGDEILVPEIGYPFFHDICPALGRKAVPYKLVREKNFDIDLEHVASLVNEKTAFMYVINPTNPMGTVFSRKHMQQILSFSDKHEVPLVCDEVYFKMVFPGVEALSFGEVTEDVPVIVLSGVEKIMSVPGWVQSWTVIFDKHNIFQKLKQNLQVMATIYLHTNTFIQHGMNKLLGELGIFTANNMPMIHDNYKKLFERVKSLPGLKPVEAQGTLYLAVEINLAEYEVIKTDINFVRLLRLQENVNVMPLSIMGNNIAGFRLLTCAGQGLYDQFFKRLGQFVVRHHKP